MPRHPERNPIAQTLGGSVYSQVEKRLSAIQGEIYRLHIGDTWLAPPVGLRMQDLAQADHPGLHRYANPHGDAALLERLAAKVASRNGLTVSGPDGVVVTAGATGGLAVAAFATVGPGDEVLVLTPYWPLIRGIVRHAGAMPIEVPFLHLAHDPSGLRAALKAAITPRTAAVYFSTPGNPAGQVLGAEVLAAIAGVARDHDLWIWADEVYEDYVYQGRHVSAGTMAPERTISVYSFSKAYGMAGHRCGYLAGPAEAMDTARRVVTHVWYSTPTAAQALGLRALSQGQAWLDDARQSYEDTGRKAADLLGLPAPEGGTFLFFDIADSLDERGLGGFLEDCLNDALLVAPGTSFGREYGTHVRLCFTAAPPDVVLRGTEKLARRLGR